MITADFIITLAVTAAAVGLTYAVQYRSVISPGYIEFDERKRKELKLMQIYNRIMESAFKLYLALTALFAAAAYFFGHMAFVMAGLYIQVIYFFPALAVMLFMYCRSRLYWKRYGQCRKTTDERKCIWE